MGSFKFVKRALLTIATFAVAFSYTQTGYTQAPCIVSRGLDPLDVLNSGVRHNVWIVLDHSGSMDNTILGETKMKVATDVLTEVMTEFVDASGRPLVNWGYVKYARNRVNSSTACDAQFSNRCVGLDMSGLIDPPACDEPDNTGDIIASLPGPTDGTGSTPNGISMDQISNSIVSSGYVAGLLPSQKNFIILVTDGDDTCECGRDGRSTPGSLDQGVWTPTASPPFASTNAVPRWLRGNFTDDSYTIDVGTNDPNIRAVNAGTKGRLAYERLNPTPADRTSGAKGGAFVIGLGLGGDSPARAHHMAWEANGAYYGNPNAKRGALLANNKTELKARLFDALADIGIPSTEVTLGAPVVGTVREVIPSWTNTFKTAADHIGDVGPTSPDSDDVRQARQVRSNHRDNVLFSTSVEIPGFKGHFRAANIYQVTDDANPRTARTPDFREIWDAGALLQAQSPNSRNLLFNRRGETLLRDFTIANVTPADLGVSAGYLSEIDGIGALTDDDARDMVVQVIRGYRLSIHPTTNTLYDTSGNLNFSEFEADGFTKTWKLYDSVASPAVMPNPTRSPDFDPPQNHGLEYGVGGSIAGDGFFWDHFNRQTMVYLPTNSGIMHGFDAGTGVEVFGYLPDDALGLASGEVAGSRDTLKDLVTLIVDENNGIPNHKFFLSGAPTVGEAFLRSDRGGDDDWHTMLTFGRGKGGRFMTALDVTDPLNPLLQFNVGNREGISDGALDHLGETWSTPVTGNVLTDASLADPDRVDQWVAFFGGGYGCDNSFDEGQYMFALRLEDGSVHYYDNVSNDSSAVIDYNALVAMPRLYNPHEEDVADKKDYVTRAYIGDVQGRVWKLDSSDPNPSNWTLEIFAELGDDQPITAPVSLVKDINNQEVYVMVGSGGDQRVDGTTTDFKFVALLDTDPDGANTLQYPLGSTPLWDRTLNPEERVYVAPVVIGKVDNAVPPVVFFAASRPVFDTAICETKFFSTLWALGIFSGTAEVDLDGGGSDENVDLGESKVTGLYARGNNLYVSESGGLGSAGSLSVYGDGDFSDSMPTGGGSFSIQVLVDGFRMSPF